MSAPTQPELESLARALARLLVAWWQEKLKQPNSKQSRAPPEAITGRSDEQFDLQAVMTIDAEKE
jgi:hypothetical protein